MRSLLGVAVAAMALLAAPVVLAQHHQGGHHGCAGSGADCGRPNCGGAATGSGPQASLYDLDTVTTLQGRVVEVTVVPASGGRSGGVHVKLESATKTGEIHLGPSWFLEQQRLELAEGDALQVTGSVVKIDGASALIAREIKKGTHVVTLRDESGVPAWSGGPRR